MRVEKKEKEDHIKVCVQIIRRDVHKLFQKKKFTKCIHAST
jgi:hypothetical protein